MKTDVFDTFAYAKIYNGTATLAIRETPEALGKPATIEVAVAFCAPEEQFEKRIGRTIAFGRLNTKRRFYCLIERNMDLRLKTQAEALLNQLIEGDNVVASPKFGWWAQEDTADARIDAGIQLPRWIDQQKSLEG
jgi:hypothetical protein